MKRRPFENELSPFDSKQFSYNREDKTISAEASDLNNRHMQQIYNDAADVGFAIRSNKTGKVVTYYLTHEERDTRENEIKWWIYEPTPESLRRVPESFGTKVMIFND